MIEREDFDLINGTLHNRHNKARRERLIPISKDILELCNEYDCVISKHFPSRKYFFPSKTPKGHYCNEWLNYQFQILWKIVNPGGTQRVRVNDLRHARAMHLYKGGMPLPLISEWLGHANMETTLIYANADTEMKQKATSKINPLISTKVEIDWKNDEEVLKQLYGLS